MDRSRTLAPVVVTAFLVIAGCAQPETAPAPVPGSPTEETPTRGGTYLHLSSGEAESLDPAYDYETAGGTVLQQVYETLVFYDGESAADLVPRLAAEMPGMNDEGTVFTFQLRPGVLFHDGNEMTAEDAKFSLDRIVLMNDPDGPAWIYGPIRGAEDYFASNMTTQDRQAYLAANGTTVVDELTLRITLAYPDPAFLYRLAYTGSSVVSRAYVCDNAGADFVDCLPPPGDTRDPWMDEHEAGTGPFRLQRWQRGEFITLERFDDYWGEAALLDQVIIRKVDDFNTRLISLRAGEADSIYVPLDRLTDVEDEAGVQIREIPTLNANFIGFTQKFCFGPDDPGYDACLNQHRDAMPLGADGTPDPLFFSDIEMRKAWTYAFDYDTYLNALLEGHGVMLNGAIPQGMFAHDPTIPTPAQDLAKARQALANSSHPDGFTVTVYYNSGNTLREKSTNLLKQSVEGLLPGQITVNVQGLDWSTAYLPKTRAAGLAVFYLGWAADYAFPDNFIVTFAHPDKGVYAKRVSYENPALTALLDEALLETDPNRLERMYSDGVRMLNGDWAFMWLGQNPSLFVARDNVRGFVANPMHTGVQDFQPGDYAKIYKV